MSTQSLHEVSEHSKLILDLVESLPRDKRNAFSSYRSRARKKGLGEDVAIKVAAEKMGITGRLPTVANSPVGSSLAEPTVGNTPVGSLPTVPTPLDMSPKTSTANELQVPVVIGANSESSLQNFKLSNSPDFLNNVIPFPSLSTHFANTSAPFVGSANNQEPLNESVLALDGIRGNDLPSQSPFTGGFHPSIEASLPVVPTVANSAVGSLQEVPTTQDINPKNSVANELQVPVVIGANSESSIQDLGLSTSFSFTSEVSYFQLFLPTTAKVPTSVGSANKNPALGEALPPSSDTRDDDLIMKTSPAESDIPLAGASTPTAEKKKSISHKIKHTFVGVHELRYLIFKLIFYCALVPTTAQAVHAFFSGINLYGNTTANFRVALILTVAVDLMTIDMLTRGANGLRVKWQKSAFGLVLAAFAAIGFNIWLTNQNLHNGANLEAKAKIEAETKADLSRSESELKIAQNRFAKAQGIYLATKWAGNSDPEACEAGKEGCRGPFISTTKDLQADALSAKSQAETANLSFEKKKSSQPVVAENSISEGDLSLRIWFYVALWTLILLASVVAPLPRKLEAEG